MSFEEKRKQTSSKRRSPKQRSISEQITFYKDLGLNGIEVYEAMVIATQAEMQKQLLLDRMAADNAKSAKKMLGLDAWHTAIEFGYWTD